MTEDDPPIYGGTEYKRRQIYSVGERIVLEPEGLRGTVLRAYDNGRIIVRWDSLYSGFMPRGVRTE